MAVKVSRGRISMTVYLEPETYAKIKARAMKLMPEVGSWEAPFLRSVLKDWLKSRESGISQNYFLKMLGEHVGMVRAAHAIATDNLKPCPVKGCKNLGFHKHETKKKR